MDARKVVLQQTLTILLGEIICCALMVGVYAIIGQLTGMVWLGALIGLVLATLNHFLMAVTVSNAADRAANTGEAKSGTNMIRLSYVLRLGLIFLILFLLVRAGVCDPVAAILPLIFVQPILMISDFFARKGGA